jgi:hypothetical protein
MGGFFSPQRIESEPKVVNPLLPEFMPLAKKIAGTIERMGEQPVGTFTPLEEQLLGESLIAGRGALGAVAPLARGQLSESAEAVRGGVLGTGVAALPSLSRMLSGSLSPVGELALGRSVGAALETFEPLLRTARGEFLGQEGPFAQFVRQRILSEAEEARRRLAGEAARSGNLAGSQFLQRMADLEARTAANLAEAAMREYSQERERQLEAARMIPALGETAVSMAVTPERIATAAAPALGTISDVLINAAMLPERTAMAAAPLVSDLGRSLMGLAALPREVNLAAFLRPIQLGTEFLGSVGRGQVVIPQVQYAPSPFAQLLGGIAGLIGPLARIGVIRF